MMHHEKLTAPSAEPSQWLFMLHGAFGSGRNWAVVAKQLIEQRSDWGVVLVDLRGHGRSQGLAAPHDLAAAARDLSDLASHLHVDPQAVLGHSFGGKVAMQFVAMNPPQLRAAFIVDSTPQATAPAGQAWDMLALLRRLPASFASRQEGIAALQDAGLSPPVAQWIAMNLHQTGSGGYRLRFDLDQIEQLLRSFYAADLWHVVESPPADVDLHFVRASRGSVISDAAAQRITAAAASNPRVHLHEVEGGHWLNVDAPEAIVKLLSRRL